MITTTNRDKAGKFTKGGNNGTLTCMDCGKRVQRANIAAMEGPKGICVRCYDKASDENSVSDGYMTCDEFLVRYGVHSEYCSGHEATSENDANEAEYDEMAADAFNAERAMIASVDR